jgi:hypothetical protein
MGNFNKTSDILSGALKRIGLTGEQAAKIGISAGIGGTIGAVGDSNHRTTGFLAGAVLGGGGMAGVGAFMGRGGIKDAAKNAKAVMEDGRINVGSANDPSYLQAIRDQKIANAKAMQQRFRDERQPGYQKQTPIPSRVAASPSLKL